MCCCNTAAMSGLKVALQCSHQRNSHSIHCRECGCVKPAATLSSPAHELAPALCEVGIDEEVCPGPVVALQTGTHEHTRMLSPSKSSCLSPSTAPAKGTDVAAACALTRNMQGPSLYTSFLPYLRTRMTKALTRKWHLHNAPTA